MPPGRKMRPLRGQDDAERRDTLMRLGRELARSTPQAVCGNPAMPTGSRRFPLAFDSAHRIAAARFTAGQASIGTRRRFRVIEATWKKRLTIPPATFPQVLPNALEVFSASR